MNPNNSRASLVFGLALIGLGILFLLQQFFDFNIWGSLWPFLVIGAGAVLFTVALTGGQETGPVFITASIVTMVGLILFTLNLTDRWEAWSYAWTLILVAVGIGLLLHGMRSGQADLRRRGVQTIQSGLVMLLLFGAFFELIIFGSARVASWVWPAGLIGLGLFLLARNLLGGRRAPAAQQALEDDQAARPN